jgi:4-amino-4-deoxy-L-arabinose transferase-like glycosyltransferase
MTRTVDDAQSHQRLTPARTLGLLAALLGAGLLLWSMTALQWRDSSGFPRPTVGVPIAAGTALLVLALTIATRLRSAGLWLALAIVGQAVSLQLVDAGKAIHWQHYRQLVTLVGEQAPLLLTVAVQAVLVAAGLLRRRASIRAWLAQRFRWWQLAGIGAVFIVSSAAAQRDLAYYVQDLALAALVQAINLGNIVLVVWALAKSSPTGLTGILDRVNQEHPLRALFGVDRLAALCALWVILLSAFLGWWSYEWFPHITDEVSYIYQARFLANGTLMLPAPPVPEAFDLYLMEFNGNHWYPAAMVGWPALLAVGVKLGAPGLVNPLLAGLNVLLAWFILRELYNGRTARLGALLLAVSPWHVFMAMNFMTHTFTLTCILVAAAGIIQARKAGQAGWGFLAGISVGVASLIRPLEGLIVGGIIGLWAIGLGGRRLNVAALAAFVAGAVLAAALVLPYNQRYTGNPTTFPLNAYLDEHFGPGRNDLGFGPNRGYGWPVQPFPGHSPLGAVVNADLNTFSINIELFGWSTGSLLLAAVLVFVGPLRRSDLLMLAVCAAVFIPYFFYYYSGGPDFGARYWYLMLLPLIALSIRGLDVLQAKLGTAGPQVLTAIALLSGLALFNYFPWRAIDKYHHFWGMRPDMRALDKTFGFGRGLVLVEANVSHPDFASAAVYNPLYWNADAPIYAWDRSPAVRARLLAAFPDRAVWIVVAPASADEPYQVLAGPLPAGAVGDRPNSGP